MILCTLAVPDDRRVLVLPSTLWPAGLHVGDRVMVDVDTGATYAGEVSLGRGDVPIVNLPCAVEAGARRAVVRRPRP